MKNLISPLKTLYIFLIIILFCSTLNAQSPEKMSFQAIVRDAGAQLVSGSSIGIQISILQGSASGSPVYVETQSPTTNENGLMSIEIGIGISSDVFSAIDWSNGPFFIKTEADPDGGTNYTIIGTSQLLSVPFSLYAKTAENVTNELDPAFTAWDKSTGISITKSQVTDLVASSETDPVFEASVAKGITTVDTTKWNDKLSSFTEIDPIYAASIAKGITANDTTKWNDKLSSYTEIDPVYEASTAKGITTADTTKWNNKLSSYTETDPVYEASIAKAIVASDITNWNNKLSVEIDGSITNEIQTLSISNNTISLTDGSNVELPIRKNLFDADSDTKVQVEEGEDDDKIRFDLGGTEKWIMDASRLEPKNSGNSIFIGEGAGNGDDLSDNRNLFLGTQAGYTNTIGANNIANGYQTLYSNQIGNSNIAIGYQAGYYETGSNKLYIENSDITTPLIYGEFDNNLLKFNGTLELANGTSASSIKFFEPSGSGSEFTKFQSQAQDASITYTLPAADGTDGYVLKTNGSGALAWVSNTSTIDEIVNAAGDTKIQVEETLNEDIIRFDLGGSEKWVMTGLRLESINYVNSVFIGKNAGLNYHPTDADGNTFIGEEAGEGLGATNIAGDYNTGMGSQSLRKNTGSYNTAYGTRSLQANTIGSYNIGMGNYALSSNTEGANNTAYGYRAGFSNIIGSSNIFLGHKAGYLETGSNKLYIANTDDTTPLIYGEFDNNLLKFNGVLELANGTSASSIKFFEPSGSGSNYTIFQSQAQAGNVTYTLPAADGTDGQVLNTDGSGVLAWETISKKASIDSVQNITIQDDDGYDVFLTASNYIYLPRASNNEGRILTVKNTGGSAVDIYVQMGSGDKIDGESGIILGEYESRKFTCYNNNWYIISDKSSSDNSSLTDHDGGTKIQVAETYNEDQIRFDLGGTEKWVMVGSRLESVGSGSSVFIGDDAGAVDDLGNKSTFIGAFAGSKNTYGEFNTAIGFSALKENIQGYGNSVIGYGALSANTEGDNNSVVGHNAMAANTTGSQNTAVGQEALTSNLIGGRNTAVGNTALYANTGSDNTAVGANSLYQNTLGVNNVAMGVFSGYNNYGGDDNIGIGWKSNFYTTAGSNNIGIGSEVLMNNLNGNNNVAVGFEAGKGSSQHNITGNIFLGYQAGYSATGDNKLYIENSNSATPLIYGEFDNDLVKINGDLNITGNLNVTGGHFVNVTSVGGNYTLLSSDYILNVSNPGADLTITLPTAQCLEGRVIVVKFATGVSSTYTIATEGSETIDGVTTYLLNTPMMSVMLYSNGTNWFTI